MSLASFCFLLLTVTLLGDDTKPQMSTLGRQPDLSPGLSEPEVSKLFSEWRERVAKTETTSEFSKLLSDARSALAPKLGQVKRLTLYSLLPVDAPKVSDLYPQKSDALLKLGRFHDFPILGEITVTDLEANRWVGFLRDQILPGSVTFCDFMPRHGFRLTTDGGVVDILMCFQCDQLWLASDKDFSPDSRPVFSIAVRDQLNQLFDKRKIERDQPKKP